MKTEREHRIKEFHALESAANLYLMQPHTLPKAQSLDGWFERLRVWHLPSFTEHRAWAVYQRWERGEQHSRTLLRQITWDYAADSKRFFDPLAGLAQGFHSYPTIEVRDRLLDTATLESYLAALQRISFPAFYDSGIIGLDGETSGIALSRPSVKIEWWCEGPESWRQITKWAGEMREWLQEVASHPIQPDVEPPLRQRRLP